MNFIRRLLGLQAGNKAAGGEVQITYEDETVSTQPPEPVVQPAPNAPLPEDNPAQNTAPTPSSANTTSTTPTTVPAELQGTRPLPPMETIQPAPGQRLSFGQLSDVGMVRSNNQDAAFCMLSSASSDDDLPDFGLFIVADGMGGYQEGERASAITVRTVVRHVLEEIFTPMLEQRMNDPERPPIADVLREAVQQANKAVTTELSEGGTTATITVILGDLVYIAHVGDSRAYMITDDGIEQITRDHSLVQRLIELEQLTPEEAAEHPQRNVLYKAIGQSESLEVDTITRRLQPRARLLLCSDGLWNLVSEDTISEMVHQYPDPQEVCNQLVKLANERGGADNITVVLVQAPG